MGKYCTRTATVARKMWVNWSCIPSPGTCTPSLTVIRPTSTSSFSCDFFGEIQPCADLRQLERGSLAEPQPLQVGSPSILPKTRILRNTKIYVSSHYSSTDRVQVRPTILLRALRGFLLNRIWMMSKICALLASPLYMQEREANADRSQVHHPVRENWMSSSSQDPTSTGGDPLRCFFKQKQVEARHTFRQRRFFLRRSTVFGKQ